jgi:MFS transporter, FHS family, glucose/mannose:H+ symporter
VTQTPAGPDQLFVPPWRILSGLAISGFLLALPGGLLPLWEFHISQDFAAAANYFALLGAGLTGGAAAAARLRKRISARHLLAAGCFGGAVSLLLLSLAGAPAVLWYRSLALLISGFSAGVLNAAVFESIARAYEANPARITLTGGIFFGVGSILAANLLAQCLKAVNPTRILAVAAIAPAAAAFAFRRLSLPEASPRLLPAAGAAKDLRSVLAILFALLLFFQFSNEWSIAGWLAVYLIDRLGLSPGNAVGLLAVYWLALTAGRLVTARLLHRVRHGRLLAASAFCALSGCASLLAAGTRAGMIAGILLTGAGFSAIYPLVAESIASRFSYYHPGYFNGIFTVAIMGGILAPFALGHLATLWGLRVVPLAAMLDSCAVFSLVLLIWLGHKVSGS